MSRYSRTSPLGCSQMLSDNIIRICVHRFESVVLLSRDLRISVEGNSHDRPA